MTDITKIPLDELRADKRASEEDALLCLNAIALGIGTYSGENTQKRLDVNVAIVVKIDEELKRRKEERHGKDSLDS